MKLYQKIPIQDCGEPLVEIPLADFAVVMPHPYAMLGAPYGDRGPYFLRQSVLDRLYQAQGWLQVQRPGWRLQIFDAYRPVAVQQFMVDYTFEQLARSHDLDPAALTPAQQTDLQSQVFQFWAPPSPDPATPPPHSTGAAVDLTLADAEGMQVNMGSAIDELSPRSYPNYFSESAEPEEQQYNRDRALLSQAMTQAGFCQHPHEWWHFSQGDQLWAWTAQAQIARYGGAV